MTNSVDNFLAHYGVKGMKWGKRRDNPERSALRIEKANTKLTITRAKTAAKNDTTPVRDANIYNARKNIKTANSEYKVRKAEAKVVKETEGKAAAQKLIREAKLERKVTTIMNQNLASQQTGVEFVNELFSNMLKP